MCHNLLIHLPVDGHLVVFHFWPQRNDQLTNRDCHGCLKTFQFWGKKKPVTVHSGCCNKTRQQKFIAHSSRGWKSKIRVPDGQGRVRFLVQSLSAFSHDERGEGLSEVCFMRALILFVRVAPSWPNHLAKAPSSNTITWDLRILTCGSGAVIGGHKHSYPSKKEE